MKKLAMALFLAAVATVVGCETGSETGRDIMEDIPKNNATVVIDGCEYIFFIDHRRAIGFAGLAHKGNCKYCKSTK